MEQVQLELPQDVYTRLSQGADQNGLSLETYLLRKLSNLSTQRDDFYFYTREEIAKQREEFDARLARLPKASEEEVERLLNEREPVPPDEALPPEIRVAFEQRIAFARKIRKELSNVQVDDEQALLDALGHALERFREPHQSVSE